MVNSANFILWIDDIGREDKTSVGDTLALFGEFYHSKIPVPNGFVITPNALHFFLEKNNLIVKIKHLLGTINPERPESIIQVSSHIQKFIHSSPFPKEISKEIFEAYEKLVKKSKKNTLSNTASLEIKTKIAGEADLIELIRVEWSKAFHLVTSHKEIVKFPVLFVSQELTPQIRGKLFTVEPDSNETGVIRIEQDIVAKYHVDKKTLEVQKKNVVNMILAEGENILDEQQVGKLADLALRIEKLVFFPQEVDFAIEKGDIYITNTRPITLDQKQIMSKILIYGTTAGRGIGIGNIKIIKSEDDLRSITPDDVVVVKHILSSDHSHLKKARALVIEDPDVNSKSAYFAKNLGIPSIIGAKDALKILRNNAIATVHASRGVVFEGSILTKYYG